MTPPDLSQRLAACTRGVPAPVMYQQWSDLLFLHWRWDAADIQRRLPPGLFVDTHDGCAWLGVVPFLMQRIRPRWLPPVPWLSWFLELNVRTYVHDHRGLPGVWFFSLDCNQPVAVRMARTFFHLPYFDARMSCRRRTGPPPAPDMKVNLNLDYRCRRRGQEQEARFSYQFLADPPPRPAEPGSLEFFLVERYVLFASSPRGIRAGRVHHSPYPLSPVQVPEWSTAPLVWDGFTAPGTPPDHIAASRGVQVRIGALEPPVASC